MTSPPSGMRPEAAGPLPPGPPQIGPGRPPARVNGVLAHLAEFEATREELTVAEEELHVQQEQLRQLLSRYEAERRWRSHLTAMLPIGLAVTDGYGKLLDANPALATHLSVPLHRLRSKPLGVFLEPVDLPGFRNGLRELSRGVVGEYRAVVGLRPRQGGLQKGQLFGFAETTAVVPTDVRLQWVLVPELPGTLDGDPTVVPDVGPDDGSLGLAAALTGLSVLPAEEADQQRILGRMALLVRGAVPGAAWVSITLGSPLDPQRLASDSQEAQDFDGRQLQAGEGPCPQAYDSGTLVVSGDVTGDERWPRLAALAAGSSVRSVLALPLRVADERRGVVNVYARNRHTFGPTNRKIAELVAGAVTGVLQSVAERESLQQLTAHLETALTSRSTIDQAKGILIAHLGVDPDEAFARLVRISSRRNVKLRDLAALLVSGDDETLVAALR